MLSWALSRCNYHYIWFCRLSDTHRQCIQLNIAKAPVKQALAIAVTSACRMGPKAIVLRHAFPQWQSLSAFGRI